MEQEETHNESFEDFWLWSLHSHTKQNENKSWRQKCEIYVCWLQCWFKSLPANWFHNGDSTTGKFKVSCDVVFNEANISCLKLDTTLAPISWHELGRSNGAMVDHELD